MGWVVYQDETDFEKIKALPEACNLLYRNGKVKIERYWDLQPLSKDQRTYQEKTIEFRERLIDSLRLHMRSDVEVGACLSGGIDSSSITSIVGHLYPDVDFKTFTIYYAGENAGADERPFVKSILQKYPHIRNVDYSPQRKLCGNVSTGCATTSMFLPTGCRTFPKTTSWNSPAGTR